MSLDKKRWRILAASCLINLCIGSVYAWSVFATPMAEYLSVSTGVALTAASLAIVFTICNSYGPVPQILGSIIIEKFGPRVLIMTGGLLFGLGMVICSFANSVGTLIVGYGICVGMGVGLAYGCTINNSVKFFPDKRGLIGGIATASYGLSSVIVPVLANALTDAFGITVTFRVIGIIFGVIICVCGCLVEKCPPDYVPEGYQPPVRTDGNRKVIDKNWREMVQDPSFYVMLLLLTSGAFFGMMVISQASPMAQNMVGMNTAAASLVVSVLALFNVGGRIVCGYISDKIGRINTLTIMLGVAICGLLLLMLFGAQEMPFYIGICLVGFSYGAFLGVYPGFTADQFGARYNTTNYALMFIGMAIAGITGPMAVSALYRATGGYSQAFFCAILLALVGLGLTVLYRVLQRKKEKNL